MNAVDLSPLRLRFLQRLRDHASTLQAHLTTLSCVPDEAETLGAAMLIFHSVAGVAGTHGMNGISTLARRAEAICDHALQEGEASQATLDELQRIVSELSALAIRQSRP